MNAYSEDLVKKTVEGIERRMPKIEAARTFGVGISSVQHRSYLDRPWGSEKSVVYRTLLRNKVWPNVARAPIHEQGAETCRFYVEALPYQKNVRSSGVWLTRYIGERLPLPIESPRSAGCRMRKQRRWRSASSSARLRRIPEVVSRYTRLRGNRIDAVY